ncbi:MAG: hypothetical protein LBS60_13410 [Deltaproteobacteria bacterium]|jgi:hypothetical protein|nr:hypothetical protein [Deltaproteobacteria bacterium]
MSYLSQPADYPELYHFEMVAHILAEELSQIQLSDDPLDVAETIEILSEEMESMPEVISRCREASETFGELDETLDRMYSLADRAIEIGAREPESLEILDDEFAGYAQIVARLAQSPDFEGPSLSLRSVTSAKVARQVLGYLSAARRDFSRRLEEQRRRIGSAMEEALELLGHILNGVDDISHETKLFLGDLVDRLSELGTALCVPKPPAPKWLN